ncbi:ferredoxin [Kitasatospora sp. GAS204A]|uniref:ferredoxin n=1 Tax=unclassified Kitasatospora TaxID=2633591 RepID=UPI00247349BB|nr:ferredoxin [Kitasatospora sp. GAS204B]MDH6117072.1 ferredoxin [Kitasatospora sp. GAS204B]
MVRVLRERCIGAGQCMRTAPAVFESDASGGVQVVEEAVGDASGTEVRLAAQLCPVQAILVADTAG